MELNEKIKFKNLKGFELVGVLHKPKQETDKAVIVTHGFTANKDRERLIEVADALANNGIAALRFDFGGCGETADREITVAEQNDDLKAAIKYIKSLGYKNVGLLGESLGGLNSILVYDKSEIKALVLYAPVTAPRTQHSLLTEEFIAVLGEDGFFTYKKDGRNFKIPKIYFEERKNINQKDILGKIKCPVLIFHGDDDKIIPRNQIKEVIKLLPKGSKLITVKSGSHSLHNQMTLVIPNTVEWFKDKLQVDKTPMV